MPIPPCAVASDRTANLAPGDIVHTAGSSYWRAALDGAADARHGVVLRHGDWGTVGYFNVPGTSGDSGSPVVDADGNPGGVIVYLHLAPPGTNGFANLEALLDAAADAGHPVKIVGYP